MARFAVLLPLVTLLTGTLSGQTAPVSDPQAVSFAQKSMAALTGGRPILDVTLTANAGLAGPDIETGTATLSAKGTGESRIDYRLRGGNRSEVRSSSAGLPQGAWSGPKTKSAPHNLAPEPTNGCRESLEIEESRF